MEKQQSADTDDPQLYSGLIRMHILYHAEEPIFGAGIIEQLARHGYRLSPGALYPMLHSMEQKGYLRSFERRSGKTARRFYSATAHGRRTLAQAQTGSGNCSPNCLNRSEPKHLRGSDKGVEFGR